MKSFNKFNKEEKGLFKFIIFMIKITFKVSKKAIKITCILTPY